MVERYLDFYDIIVNELVGDPTLFIFVIFLLATIYLSINRTPFQVMVVVFFAVGAILAIQFTVLRYLMPIFGLGFFAWMVASRIRR